MEHSPRAVGNGKMNGEGRYCSNEEQLPQRREVREGVPAGEERDLCCPPLDRVLSKARSR
jgi:hypothetical protein